MVSSYQADIEAIIESYIEHNDQPQHCSSLISDNDVVTAGQALRGGPGDWTADCGVPVLRPHHPSQPLPGLLQACGDYEASSVQWRGSV